MDRSNLIGVAFGLAVLGFIGWKAFETPTPHIFKTPDGREFVCKDQAQEPGDCASVDKFR